MPKNFQWTFEDGTIKSRNRAWVPLLVIVGIALIVYALATLNFLFAFIIFMAGIVFLLDHFRGPKTTTITINSAGIKISSKLFAYPDLRNFWIFYQPPIKLLYLKPKSLFLPSLSVSLEDQDPVDLRQFLRQYLEEDLEREHEPITDRIARKLKI